MITGDKLLQSERPLSEKWIQELSERLDPDPKSKGQQHSFYGAAKEVFESDSDECIIGGGADTGKTIACLSRINLLAHSYENARGLIVRKVKEDMWSTVLETFRTKILADGDGVRAFGGERPSWYDYPNGTRIWVVGMDRPSKALSGEFDFIYVNQAEELTLPDWEILGSRASGRAGNVPNAQIIGDCNPEAPTHWIMQRKRAKALQYFESKHTDNPELFDPETGFMTEAGEVRLRRLSKLTGSRKQRLYHGLWVQPEGAIYGVFDEEKHKVEGFNPPALWPRLVGIDPFGAHIAALWLAFDPAAGILNVYREYYEPFGVTTPKHVDNILKASANESIFAWVGGGPSERQQRVDFSGAGIPLLAPPITDVWAGIDRVYQLLDDFALVIHDSCEQLLDEIGRYKRKMDKQGNPTEKIEEKESFHLLDALRYAIVWITDAGADQDGEREEMVYNPIKIGRDY